MSWNKITSVPTFPNMDKGATALIFETNNRTIIIKDVPTDICDNCGESFISEKNSKKLLGMAHKEAKKGKEMEILHYTA